MAALKNLLGLIDDKLEAVFHKKTPDATSLRAKVVEGIDRSRTQFLATEPVRGRKWFKVANNVVAFSPMLPGSVPLLINGKATNYIPGERFTDFLDNMKAAVEAGEFDAELLAEPGEAKPAASPRVSTEPKAKRAGWSPERRAAQAASIAARKAAKG